MNRKKIHAARTPLDVLNDGKGALLLTLDEAQTVSEKIPSEHHPLSKVVLDSLHNGDVDRPVVLAAGGLSMTREVFRGMGVSRFEAHSFVGLGRMRDASVRKVVKDWLIQEGGANGEPVQWVDAIAPETYGWPQHIVSYIRPAVWHLVANSGEMTRDGLQKVLEEGRKQCAEFYEARSDGLHKKDIIGLQVPSPGLILLALNSTPNSYAISTFPLFFSSALLRWTGCSPGHDCVLRL